MDAPDPAVRAIQIATTLIGRLVELVKAPGVIESATAIVAPEVASDALELRIGEALQIEPEMWRHLDDARSTLLARGLDVSNYDELRRSYRSGTLSFVDIQLPGTRDIFGLATELHVIKSKTATWDARVIKAATAAAWMLKERLQGVDWAALDRADNEQIAAVGSLKAARWKGMGRWIAIAVVIAGIAVGAGVIANRSRDTSAAVDPHAPTVQERAVANTKDAQKLASLREKYAANPCDTQTVKSLTAYLYVMKQEAESAAIEEKWAAQCSVPARP